jgi:hypothetical protein
LEWLKDVLEKIPACKANMQYELSPQNWQKIKEQKIRLWRLIFHCGHKKLLRGRSNSVVDTRNRAGAGHFLQ